MNRAFTFLLFFILLAMFFPLSSFAGKLSPGVEDVLRSASPAQEIPVIVTLSGKADLGAISEKNKETKREKIVKALKEQAAVSQGPLLAMLKGRGAKRLIPFWVANSIAATVSPAVISELISFPGIERIELDSVVPAPVITPAAVSTPEWNIARINAPALWDAGITGAGVVVANLDTGVDPLHPDLLGKWRGNMSDQSDPINTVSWYNPYADPANCCLCANAAPTCNPVTCSGSNCSSCELSSAIPCDDEGHGTGTMGVMVGGSAGGTAIGVAPDAKWIAVKIFPSPPAAGALSSIILQGLQWILSLPPGSEPDVVNNSWGIEAYPGSCILFFMDAISNLKAAGIEVVFSAGNSGPSPSSSLSPANNPGAFAVGATADASNNIASFSSRGPSACDDSIFPHVVAPGVGIKLADLTGGGVFPDSYNYQNGTSFSAPHVAGAIALLTSVFPSVTPSELETSLKQSALHLIGPPPDDTVPNNVYGYGLIDVSGALIYFTSHGEIAIPEITGYQASYDFGNVPFDGTPPSGTFTLTNRSGGTLHINSLTITGASEFTVPIATDTCSGKDLAASTSCSFILILDTTSTGQKTAQLSISYGSPAVFYDMPLSGFILDRVIRKQGSTIVATYSTIEAAFEDCNNDNCVNGDIIAAREGTFGDVLDFDSSLGITVELQGGYDPSFGSQSGLSAVNALTVRRGVVAVGNVTMQ